MSRKFLTPIQLPADPVNPLEAATKQYVDGKTAASSGDEVSIGTTDPGAAYDLWYDTSASSFLPFSPGLDASKPAASAALRGFHYFATDTNREYLCDGTGWMIMSEPIQTSYVPSVAPSGGAFTTLGAKFFNYQRSDGWLEYEFSVLITTNGTASGTVVCQLPIAPAITAAAVCGHGREVQSTGNVLVAQTGAPSMMNIINYNNAYPGGSNYNLWVTGRYRMASRYS